MRWLACQAGAEQQDILREGAGSLDALEAALGRWEVRRLLGGAYDRGPAMLSIQVPLRAACICSSFSFSSCSGLQAEGVARW